MERHILNFNTNCNTVGANNAAASALRDLAIAVKQLERDLLDKDTEALLCRIADLVDVHINRFEVRDEDGSVVV